MLDRAESCEGRDPHVRLAPALNHQLSQVPAYSNPCHRVYPAPRSFIVMPNKIHCRFLATRLFYLGFKHNDALVLWGAQPPRLLFGAPRAERERVEEYETVD